MLSEVEGIVAAEQLSEFESSSRAKREVMKGSGAWGLGTLSSRALGLFREVLISRTFGTSSAASAIVVGQTVPNLARSLVGDDVAQGAMVPVLSEHLDAGDEATASAIVRRVTMATTVVLGIATVLIWLASSAIVKVLAPGVKDAHALSQIRLVFRIMAPTIILNGFAASGSAYLIARRRFATASAAVALSNFPAVLALVIAPHASLTTVAEMLALGLLLQAGVQIWAAHRQGFRMGSTGDAKPGTRVILGLALPVALSLGFANFSGVVDTAFSTMLQRGGPAALDKAFRLMLVPFAVLGAAVAVAALRELASAHRRSREDFRERLSEAFCLQTALLIPTAIALYYLARPIVTMVYARGAFGHASIALTTQALRGMAFALPCLGLGLLGSRAWLVQRRPWIAASAAGVGVGLNVLLDWLLIKPFGIAGIGIATGIVHGVVGLGLLVAASGDPRSFLKGLCSPTVRILCSCICAIAAGFLFGRGEIEPMTIEGLCRIGAMTLAFLVSARALRIETYGEIVAMLKARGR
jgi:putative peptidoglycan lipid II flippase